MVEFLWEATDSPEPADVGTVDDGLEGANQAATDFSGVQPLACFVRLPSGSLVGGAIARTWGECCELRQLWVAPAYRRCGIGRRLIQRVEAEARSRGCTLVYLETFSFQAPEFYLALGFCVACEFAGFPKGVVKYIMRKNLVGMNAPDSAPRQL